MAKRVYTPEQREAAKARARAWFQNNRERAKASRKKWRDANPEKVNASRRKWAADHPLQHEEASRKSVRKWKYGIDDARKSGICEICGTHADSIHCDHDHTTGKFRGWLCRGCNHMLGHAKDSPDILTRGADYLRKTGNLVD